MHLFWVSLIAVSVAIGVLPAESKVCAQETYPPTVAAEFISEVSRALSVRNSARNEWNSSFRRFDSVDAFAKPNAGGLVEQTLTICDGRIKEIENKKNHLSTVRKQLSNRSKSESSEEAVAWLMKSESLENELKGMLAEQAISRFNRYVDVRSTMLDARLVAVTAERDFLLEKSKRLVSIREKIEESARIVAETESLLPNLRLPENDRARELTKRAISDIYRRELVQLKEYLNRTYDPKQAEKVFESNRTLNDMGSRLLRFKEVISFAESLNVSTTEQMKVDEWVLDLLARKVLEEYPNAIAGQFAGFDMKKFQTCVERLKTERMVESENFKFQYESARHGKRKLVNLDFQQKNIVDIGAFLDKETREKLEAEVGVGPEDFVETSIPR